MANSYRVKDVGDVPTMMEAMRLAEEAFPVTAPRARWLLFALLNVMAPLGGASVCVLALIYAIGPDQVRADEPYLIVAILLGVGVTFTLGRFANGRMERAAAAHLADSFSEAGRFTEIAATGLRVVEEDAVSTIGWPAVTGVRVGALSIVVMAGMTWLHLPKAALDDPETALADIRAWAAV